MRILLIEDDPSIAQAIEIMLGVEDMVVHATDLGEEGIDLAKVYDYDMILLDLNLPDMSGLEVARHIREAKVATPLLMLTSVADVSAKLKAFGYGADDYVIKPFNGQELIARIKAIVRRSQGHAHSAITIGPVTIDLDRKTASVKGEDIHLTGKEFSMLEAFALRRGVTLTKENLMSQLYGGMDEPELKIIDVFVCKLRKKLTDAGAPNLIETIWGRGYVMRDLNAPAEAPASGVAAA